MRVLHCSDVYLPRLGGIENQVHDLARQQRQQGDEVVVATSTAAPSGERGERADRDDDVRRLSGVLSGAVGPLVDRIAPDVVHCHTSVLSPLAWSAARAAVRRGLPTVVTMHSLIPDGGIGDLFGRVGRALGDVTWTSVSTVAVESLQSQLRRPVLLLPNGIDAAAWHGTASPRGPGERTAVLVAAMRMSGRKRPLPLLRVLRRVADASGDAAWRAVVVGDGPQLRSARRETARLGLTDRVDLLGRVGRGELSQLLAGADVFLAPAFLESFVVAALEARCAGLAVVAMREGGVRDFVQDGVNGFLAGDDDELARAITGLVRDPARLARIRTTNRLAPPPMDWAQVLPQVREVYALAASWDRVARPR